MVAGQAAEPSGEFLGRAANVETLTTAGPRPLGDLRRAAGDGEQRRNGVRLRPACFSDKTNERARLKGPAGAGGPVRVLLGPAEPEKQNFSFCN